MHMTTKIIELFIDEDGDWLNKISLVDEPAIDVPFLTFNKTETEFNFSINSDKQIITGPVMIPNKKMYRKTKEQGEFYVFFSAETIRKAAYEWLKQGKNKEFNLDHEYNTTQLSVIESWIKEDEKDKSTFLGFSTDIPVGTWFVSVKVDDEQLWQKIKNGKEYNGFSVEGWFEYEKFTSNLSDEETIKELKELLKDY